MRLNKNVQNIKLTCEHELYLFVFEASPLFQQRHPTLGQQSLAYKAGNKILPIIIKKKKRYELPNQSAVVKNVCIIYKYVILTCFVQGFCTE